MAGHVNEVRGGFRMLLRTLVAIGDLLAADNVEMSRRAADRWWDLKLELDGEGWL